jgi:hypothetical protein
MLYITGDIHGKEDFRRLSPRFFPLQKTLSENDFLLVAGDFGFPSLPRSLDDDPYLDDLAGRPYTTLFVDGNHEHYDVLESLPEVSFGGSPAGAMRGNVLHLKRGYIYTIGGIRVFAFGGAASPIKGLAGYPHDPVREIPSLEEMERACDSLVEAGWDVDLILTHTAPVRYLEAVYEQLFPCPASLFLQGVCEEVSFRRWFAGHHHVDADYSNGFSFIYERIVSLTPSCLADPREPPPNHRTGLEKGKDWRVYDTPPCSA